MYFSRFMTWELGSVYPLCIMTITLLALDEHDCIYCFACIGVKEWLTPNLS